MAAPDHGLTRNDSGLPATLPLIVRGAAEALDVALLGSDGTVVLTAHAQSGRVLRVLVPPGTWRVRISGEGSAAIYGPLTFAAGTRRRSGHLIDLAGADARPFKLCQIIGPVDSVPPLRLADPTPDEETLDERLRPDVLVRDPGRILALRDPVRPDMTLHTLPCD